MSGLSFADCQSTDAGHEANTDAVLEAVLQSDLPVPMSDGVHLATDVYLPGQNGKPTPGRYPVILERTPYGKSKTSRGEIDRGARTQLDRREVAEFFVRHGYVVIYQDCRGRGKSEGEFTKYLSEGRDGVDTINWIREQSWCNGSIGMMGLSYAAHTQTAPAAFAPVGLSALVVDCGGFSSGYHWGMRQGGALELRQATWAYTHAKASSAAVADPSVRAALEAEDLPSWFRALPWRPGASPLKWVPEYENYLFEQWRNGTFGEYWKKNGIYLRDSYAKLAQIPQIHLSGWYDTYVATAVENFVGVTEQRNAPARLIIGPWTHGDRALTYAGDVDFGEEAALDGNLSANWRQLRLEWFDRFMKPAGRAVQADEEPVMLFIMGGGQGDKDSAGRLRHGGHWIGSPTWPPKGSVETSLFLHADRTLSFESAGRSEASLTYRFDPTKPTPTIGGAFSSGAPIFYAGAYDQREGERFFGSTAPGRPLASRDDVLVFQTETLAEDVILAGPVRAELWISSDAPDTDFTAKLIDEYPPSADFPDGFAMNLTDGILRCRYRDSWEKPEMMEAGKVYRITIELMPTASLFKAGHRIRLDISSSNFPKFDINPNSGEPESIAEMPRIATNTVHLDASRPSRLIVNVLPKV